MNSQFFAFQQQLVLTKVLASLSFIATKVYLALGALVNRKSNQSWFTLAVIAEYAGVGINSVTLAVHELVELGLIKTWWHGGRKYYSINRYWQPQEEEAEEIEIESIEVEQPEVESPESTRVEFPEPNCTKINFSEIEAPDPEPIQIEQTESPEPELIEIEQSETELFEPEPTQVEQTESPEPKLSEPDPQEPESPEPPQQDAKYPNPEKQEQQNTPFPKIGNQVEINPENRERQKLSFSDKTNLSTVCNRLVDKFYEAIEQPKTSGKVKNTTHNIIRGLLKEEYSEDEIAFAIDYTVMIKGKNHVYSARLLPHMIGEALAKRPQIEEQIKRKADREELARNKASIEARLNEIQLQVSAYKKTLPFDDLDDYKMRVEEELDREKVPVTLRLTPFIRARVDKLIMRELGLFDEYERLSNMLKPAKKAKKKRDRRLLSEIRAEEQAQFATGY